MRKLLCLVLILVLFAPNSFAWGFKKKQTPEFDPSKGYVGTLPDVSKSFATEDPDAVKPLVEKTKRFNSADEIKPVPRDNPAFVNIILKDEKTTPYINDINDLLPLLENILACIDDNLAVQIFNAKVYFFNKTVEYLAKKYDGTPESSYSSFQKILELSTHTKSIANLRAEAERYKPYLAYTGAGYLYNDNVINQQLEYLKTEIEDTIIAIKETE